MTDKLRKITRLLAIPLLILIWCLHIIMGFIYFICCVCDLRPDEWDVFPEDLIQLIREWVREGVNSL